MTAADYRGTRALVLGAAGFIGRWVTRLLAARGARAIAVARHATQARTMLDTFGAREAELVEADLAQLDLVEPLIREVNPAIVFNLAGYGVDQAERDEQLATTINTELAAIVAEAVAALPPAPWSGLRLVHAGSALEYGERDDDLPEDGPCRPHTLYGRTKLAGTEAVTRVIEKQGLRAVTARLFTIYGPGEHATRLLPTLLAALRTGGRVPLTAGTQRRDYTYVEDVAEALLRLGALTGDVPPVVNVATGQLTAVRRLAEIAAEVLGIPSDRLDFGALPGRVEMEHQPVTLALLESLTGWTPGTSVAEGVARTARFRS